MRVGEEGRMRVTTVVAAVFLVATGYPQQAAGQGECAENPAERIVHFTHQGAKETSIVSEELAPGQAFRVCVRRTDPAAFEYLLFDVARSDDPIDRLAARALSSVLVPEASQPAKVHDQRWRGYVLEVRRKAIGPCEGDCQSLQPVRLVIEVATSSWSVETSGAFTVSSLVDPQFYTVTGDGGSIVYEDKNAEDAARPGIAAFAAIHHRRFERWNPLAFGIGIETSGRTSYYLGSGLRFGNRAGVTAGAVLGTVQRLPTGITPGGPISDPALLGSLPTQTRWGWFVAFSFGFTGPGLDALKKPFAPTPLK
jgi:hypothetical protein